MKTITCDPVLEDLQSSDRQHEYRILEDAEVSIKIKTAPEAKELEGKTFPSRIAEISFGGLQMHLDCDIPIGALLILEIVFTGSQNKYWHIGKVMWKNDPIEDIIEQKPGYRIGIVFESSDNPQHDSWISEVMDIHEKAKINQPVCQL